MMLTMNANENFSILFNPSLHKRTKQLDMVTSLDNEFASKKRKKS